MTQRWSCWKWRKLGLMGRFRNLLGLLLSSKVPSNGKRSTRCTHSHPILGSGNRWGTICHWHTGPHTQLTPGEQSWKTWWTTSPQLLFLSGGTWLYSPEASLCFLYFFQSFGWITIGQMDGRGLGNWGKILWEFCKEIILDCLENFACHRKPNLSILFLYIIAYITESYDCE